MWSPPTGTTDTLSISPPAGPSPQRPGHAAGDAKRKHELLFIFGLEEYINFWKVREKVLQTLEKDGKMLTVKDGYLVCPNCRRNKRLIQVRPETRAERLVVFCRDCKTETIVDIDKGQCFESRGR